MKLKCLSCQALTRMAYLCAAYSPHQVDVELLEIGLHNRPDGLREQLQLRIDALAEPEGDSPAYDAVVLAYGLCGKATAGLVAREIPLVIPRAHDCITLFLGSRFRYQDQFDNQPGTYWYVQDYMERRDSTGTGLSLGAGGMDAENPADLYADYVARFGKDNADYLMEAMGAWQSHYQRAVYIDMGIGSDQATMARTQDEAQRRGWTFERMEGDLILIRKLLEGDWDDDFLVVPPGQAIGMSYDEDILLCS